MIAAITAPTCLALKVPGNMIGPVAVIISNLAGLGALVLLQALPESPGPVEVIDVGRRARLQPAGKGRPIALLVLAPGVAAVPAFLCALTGQGLPASDWQVVPAGTGRYAKVPPGIRCCHLPWPVGTDRSLRESAASAQP